MWRPCVVLAWCLLILQPLRGGLEGHCLAQESASVSDILVHGPREFRRGADLLKAAVAGESCLTAASHLDRLFATVADGDFFLVDQDQRFVAGAKSELWRTTLNLPRPVLDAYQELTGNTAETELQKALRDRDFDAIEVVANRWFTTRAGVEARLLLARNYLDGGLPHEALNCLSPLLSESVLSQPFQPELTLLRCIACLLTGRLAESKSNLEWLAQTQGGVSYRIGNRELSLSDADSAFQDLRHALGDVGDAPISSRISSHDWPLHRRDPRRSTVGDATVPAQCDWVHSLSAAQESPQTITKLRDDLIDSDIPAVPCGSPIAIGHQVVFPTPTDIRSIDLRDGSLLWKFPPAIAAPQGLTVDAGGQAPGSSSTGSIYSRIWNDAIHNHLSSDGRYVYLIEGLDQQKTPHAALVLPLGLNSTSTEQPLPSNRLVALELGGYGSFLWTVDKYHGKAKQTTEDAFFLGPPVPVANSLYTIAEFDHQLCLVKIDAVTGRQQWLLPYAEVSTRGTSVRRQALTGVSPSYSEGILICPTSLGAVVAFDLATQRFVWGHCYAQTEPRRMNNRLPNVPPTTQDWQDHSAIIVGHRVLIAPANADLQCLDLHTGNRLWSRRRSDLLLVAAADQDIVLLVGQHRFTGLRISDGSYAWEDTPYVAIPAGGMPSGRGILSGHSYFLPTTDPELLQIDLPTGKTIRHQPADQILGNLICSHDRIVSQSPLSIACLGSQAPGTQTARNDSPRPRQLAKATTGELLGWLGNPDFYCREAVTRELVERRGDAIPQLTAALKSDEPEVAYRATAVLIAFLSADDPDVAFQSRQALVSGGSDEGSLAAKSLAREMRRREPLAKEKLVELGAMFHDHGRRVTLGPHWEGDNDDLRHLQWLSRLATLELRHGSINDDGLRLLCGLNSIQTLNLNRTQVTHEGILYLATLQGLRVLLLQNTGLDDRALPHLTRLKNLRAINLLDTDITREGVEGLRRLMPKTQILY